MKKSVSILFIILTTGILIGCSQQDLVSEFEKLATQEVTHVLTYQDVSDEDINHSLSNDLESINTKIIGLSSQTLEVSNADEIEEIRKLFQDIRTTHLENVSLVYQTRDSRDQLVSNIRIFRDLDQELSTDDRNILRAFRTEIRTRRSEVILTHYEIIRLFSELRGKYQIENIEMIKANLTEILSILQLRQDYIAYLDSAIVDVNLMITNYLV